MEESIGKFCKTMGYFCNHLQGSCHSLKQSVERLPIPLDSASTTFVQCLNRRVSSTSSDLNLLESMSFGTVSFEELVGHCNEVYKKNQNDILELEDRLCSYGYVPEVEVEVDDELEDVLNDSQPTISLNLKTVEDDSLFEDSLNLQNLGLSDACLATIASDANSNFDTNESYEAVNRMLEGTDEEEKHELETFEDRKRGIHIVKDDYESLPSYMKSSASWDDLLAAVEKMNSKLKEKMKGKNFFQQDEISSLGLGPKGRSYLLLLVKMNKLVVETIDGMVSYRLL